MKKKSLFNSLHLAIILALAIPTFILKAQFSPTWLGNVPNWNPSGSGNSEPALKDPTPWSLGGNAIYGMPGGWFPSITNVPNPLYKTASIGTVDDATFSLKANNREAIFINPSSKVSLGWNNTGGSAPVDIWSDLNPPSNQSRLSFFVDLQGNIESSESMSLLYLAGQTFNVNEGSVLGGSVSRITIANNGKCGINNSAPQAALDIHSNSSSGSFRIFGDVAGNVHSTTDLKLHYGNTPGASEFQIKSGDPTNATTRMLLNSFGTHINTDGTSFNGMFIGPASSTWYNNCFSHRLWVDAVNSHGLAIVGGNGNEAINIFNSAGALRFGMKIINGGGDDTKFKLSGSAQFGFFNSTNSFEDVNTRLNVDAFGTNGVKVITNNASNKAFYVENTSLAQPIAFEVKGDGKTHIGTWRPNVNGPCANAMLTVDGQILAKEIRVAISQGNGTSHRWADYVFEKDYKLMPLKEVEKFVTKNHHLPEVPSEAEVLKDGVDVTAVNIALLKKIEELYLYVFELEKQVNGKLQQANTK
jgi:hypothetical protein